MTTRGTITRRTLLRQGLAAAAVPALAPLCVAPVRAQDAAVWRDMDQAALDAAYDQRAYAPNMDLVLQQHAFMNAAAARRLNTPQRFSYGRAAIETLDYYRGPSTGAPIHIFLHGGTWRSNTALGYAFVAEPLLRAGAHVVIPDFSSVDDAPGGLADLVTQVRTAIAWVYSRAIELGGDRERIFVSGHSSGGHLAAAALTTNWPADFGLPYSVLRGGLCISGIFDLEPVRLSWRNEYLKLTDPSVQALSPQRHLNFLSAPLVLAYGTEETPEFQRQSRDFASAARSAGHDVEVLVGDGYNHFEMLGTLASPYGLAGRAALAQMRLARG